MNNEQHNAYGRKLTHVHIISSILIVLFSSFKLMFKQRIGEDTNKELNEHFIFIDDKTPEGISSLEYCVYSNDEDNVKFVMWYNGQEVPVEVKQCNINDRSALNVNEFIRDVSQVISDFCLSNLVSIPNETKNKHTPLPLVKTHHSEKVHTKEIQTIEKIDTFDRYCINFIDGSVHYVLLKENVPIDIKAGDFAYSDGENEYKYISKLHIH